MKCPHCESTINYAKIYPDFEDSKLVQCPILICQKDISIEWFKKQQKQIKKSDYSSVVIGPSWFQKQQEQIKKSNT